MLFVLRYFKMICLALLTISIIISTKWILGGLFLGHGSSDLYLSLLYQISWYGTAPLLCALFIIMGLEKWLGSGE